MNFLLFILIAYGLTQILVYSDMPILKKLRPSKESYRGYGKVVHGLSRWLVFGSTFSLDRTIYV
jgi:hypothetical protein